MHHYHLLRGRAAGRLRSSTYLSIPGPRPRPTRSTRSPSWVGRIVPVFSQVGSTLFTVNVSPVPERGTLVLLGSGLVASAVRRRQHRFDSRQSNNVFDRNTATATRTTPRKRCI